MKISIIIPTYNEADGIGKLIYFLRENSNNLVKEIIVSDGGSTDQTIEKAQEAGATIVKSPEKGRASQMNYGASMAGGEILYFVHADTIPPKTYATDIIKALKDDSDFGRYRTIFDSKNFLLKINAFFTRYDLFICYGGDQTLFIKKSFFDRIGGFNRDHKIMEDYELTTRAKNAGGTYRILGKNVLVSARKYKINSWLKVQWANYKVVKMYKKGAPQDAIISTYHQMLRLEKTA